LFTPNRRVFLLGKKQGVLNVGYNNVKRQDENVAPFVTLFAVNTNANQRKNPSSIRLSFVSYTTFIFQKVGTTASLLPITVIPRSSGLYGEKGGPDFPGIRITEEKLHDTDNKKSSPDVTAQLLEV
jgi:hypothetical protein